MNALHDKHSSVATPPSADVAIQGVFYDRGSNGLVDQKLTVTYSHVVHAVWIKVDAKFISFIVRFHIKIKE